MKVYEILGVIALLALVILIPLYATQESARMVEAQIGLKDQLIADAADLFLTNCSTCHGLDGKGLGVTPALNDPVLAQIDTSALYDTIAHSPHGSVMAAWHVAEGGTLSTYQVESLVTLISQSGWDQVAVMAEDMALTQPTEAEVIREIAALEPTGQDDPHECRNCHEEPLVHAERFGLNCARCHNLQAWKPALLTRHVFRLDHGGAGRVDCQTCHTESYAEHTCYGCHDHQPDGMATAHLALEITDYENCVLCHPTGVAGEASALEAALPAGQDAATSGN